MRGKRVVVMGGAGFLGSHLCEAVLAQGGEAVAVDNLCTGALENVAHLQGKPGFTFVERDVTEKFDIEGPVHFVLNFASPASPFDYARLPIETLRVGSLGTEHGLQLALSKDAVFLQASTSEVYGDPSVHPQPESYWGHVSSTGPRSCYDEAKRYGEALVMAYHRARGAKTRMVRIFNTYGPRMRTDDGRVVPAFITQALGNEPFTVFGDGTQTRSFCYVDDEVRGILALAQSDVVEPVNIGNPAEFTMLAFAETVKRLAGSTSTTRFMPLPTDDPKQRRPDITKAKALLGWEPQITHEEGLRRTIEWFRVRG